MPLYEYQCENCGERFEVMQKFSDEPLATHAKCGGKVDRLLSAPALQFKGSGWYINDYAKGSGNQSKANDGKENKSSKSSETSTAATPSATPASSSNNSSKSSDTK